jgi:hypothetical protein
MFIKQRYAHGLDMLPRVEVIACQLTGVVSAPLWNSEESKFAGMLTVLDIIHLIQWYHKNSTTYENVATDVESFRLESLRGM